MPTPLSINDSLGAAVYPLEVGDVAARQIFPDKVKHELLALYKAAINYELDGTDPAASPWVTVVQGTALDGKRPVHDFYPGLPTEQLLQERKGDFPILFLDRNGSGEFITEGGGAVAGAGLEEEAVQCDWSLTWCLGPLTAGDAHRFRAALTVWVPNLVRMVTEDRRHPAFTPSGINGDGIRPDGTPYLPGQIGFGPGGIPLGSIEAVSFDGAAVPIGDNSQLYHGVTVTLRTVEYATPPGPDEGVPFLGQNHHIRVGGKEGLVPGILELDTTHPPKKQ